MQGEVLVLSGLKTLLERLVDRFQTEEGHWEENCQVILCDDLHLRGVARVHKHLEDLFDFLVSEHIELVVLVDLILHNALNLTSQRQVSQLRWQTQTGAF